MIREPSRQGGRLHAVPTQHDIVENENIRAFHNDRDVLDRCTIQHLPGLQAGPATLFVVTDDPATH
jgi:hypothetical protein